MPETNVCWSSLGGAALILLVSSGCGPSPQAKPSTPATSASTEPGKPDSDPLTCTRELGIPLPTEAETPEDPASWISLRELYPAHPPEDLRVAPPPQPSKDGVIDVGEHEVFLPSWGEQWGLTTRWESDPIDPEMLREGISPQTHGALVEFLEAAAQFEKATKREQRAMQELYYLIAVTNEEDAFLDQASDCFDAVEEHYFDAKEDAEDRLMEALEEVAAAIHENSEKNGSLTPQERYALGEMGLYDDATEIEQTVEFFESVATDPSTPRILRNLARERAAVWTGDEEMIREALADDPSPELERRLMILLVDAYDEEDEHEVALLNELIEYLGQQQPPPPELARRRGHRARYRLEAGDMVGARDDAIACLREPSVDPEDDEYTHAWSCTVSLANALTTLGQEAPDVTIPPRAAGLLASWLMTHAASHGDVATARHVGHVALRVAPESPRIPGILGHLAVLEPDEHNRAQLLRDLERVGTSGPWRDAQLRRLAFELDEDDQVNDEVLEDVEDLTEVRLEFVSPEELAKPLAWTDRLERIVEECNDELQRGGRYRIDVRGGGKNGPSIAVRGPKGQACVRTHLPGYLRDLGSNRLRAVLKIEDS